MANVQDSLNELTKQKNTLSFIDQSIQRLDFEQVRLITDNTFNIDKVRIDAIREFLIIERGEVQSIIDSILDQNVSGV